jgi:hypothetical protein
MNSTCTLLNYPGFTFTQSQLLSFQDQGVKFDANTFKEVHDSAPYCGSSWEFSSFRTLNYFVVETPENKSLFEKIAGINQVNQKKTKPRVHADLIKAWAEDDSLVIEYWNFCAGEWRVAVDNSPVWYNKTEYRIKPSVDTDVISKGISQGISTCKAMLVLSEEV